MIADAHLTADRIKAVGTAPIIHPIATQTAMKTNIAADIPTASTDAPFHGCINAMLRR